MKKEENIKPQYIEIINPLFIQAQLEQFIIKNENKSEVDKDDLVNNWKGFEEVPLNSYENNNDFFDPFDEKASSKSILTRPNKLGISIPRARRLCISIPKVNRVVHDSDINFMNGFITSLIGISEALYDYSKIKFTLITSAITFFISVILPIYKKGAKLTEEQMDVLISLKLLSEKNKNKANIDDLVSILNKKAKQKWGKRHVIKLLKELQNITHNDGTVSKFVDSSDKKIWWAVDV